VQFWIWNSPEVWVPACSTTAWIPYTCRARTACYYWIPPFTSPGPACHHGPGCRAAYLHAGCAVAGFTGWILPLPVLHYWITTSHLPAVTDTAATAAGMIACLPPAAATCLPAWEIPSAWVSAPAWIAAVTDHAPATLDRLLPLPAPPAHSLPHTYRYTTATTCHPAALPAPFCHHCITPLSPHCAISSTTTVPAPAAAATYLSTPLLPLLHHRILLPPACTPPGGMHVPPAGSHACHLATTASSGILCLPTCVHTTTISTHHGSTRTCYHTFRHTFLPRFITFLPELPPPPFLHYRLRTYTAGADTTVHYVTAFHTTYWDLPHTLPAPHSPHHHCAWVPLPETTLLHTTCLTVTCTTCHYTSFDI